MTDKITKKLDEFQQRIDQTNYNGHEDDVQALLKIARVANGCLEDAHFFPSILAEALKELGEL